MVFDRGDNYLKDRGKESLASVAWLPCEKDLKALAAHHYVMGIDRVDQIWPG